MTRARIALRVPVGRSLPDLAAFVARCEDAGLDGVGIHDHPSSGRDAYMALALAARATQRLQLFPATSSPLVRHPLVLASLAHSLEEIAPGRTYLTVAPGFISTRSVGKPRASVAFMREAIRDLRRVCIRQPSAPRFVTCSKGPNGPAARWPASRWCSWSRSVSDPTPRWERVGCGAGLLRVNPSWPIRAPRIFAGSGKPASSSRKRTIPPPYPRIKRGE